MNHKPILFSTPMVQAILDGRKSMTRRCVKMYASSDNHPARQNANWLQENKTCPYGNVGDLLWVRETWCISGKTTKHFAYKADSNDWVIATWKPSIHMPKAAARIWLKIEEIRVERLQDISEEDILNEGIRIPVSNKATENNKVIMELTGENKAIHFLRKNALDPNAKITQQEFLFAFWAELWCAINGKESWDANPWVWVIKFSRVEKPSAL